MIRSNWATSKMRSLANRNSLDLGFALLFNLAIFVLCFATAALDSLRRAVSLAVKFPPFFFLAAEGPKFFT